MMTIIREARMPEEKDKATDDKADEGGSYWSTHARCVVRSNCYGSSMAYFRELLAAARKDFPDLTDEDAEFKCYGGISYSGTFGMEFNVPADTVPAHYRRIREMEYTR